VRVCIIWKRNYVPFLELEPLFLSFPVYRLIVILTDLSQFTRQKKKSEFCISNNVKNFGKIFDIPEDIFGYNFGFVYHVGSCIVKALHYWTCDNSRTYEVQFYYIRHLSVKIYKMYSH
jgi:hypothetical protein